MQYRPSKRMVKSAKASLKEAAARDLIIDYDVKYTGDDICLLMVHDRGESDPDIHNLAWDIFTDAGQIAADDGLYGAGQDLLVDAPSGNVRGAGPGAAEISIDPSKAERPAEPFLIFTADTLTIRYGPRPLCRRSRALRTQWTPNAKE